MKLLNTTQAAEYLSIAKKTLEHYRFQGGGPPYVKLGAKCVRYQVETLNAWIAERIRVSTSDSGYAPATA